jgi:hypothetical protein
VPEVRTEQSWRGSVALSFDEAVDVLVMAERLMLLPGADQRAMGAAKVLREQILRELGDPERPSEPLGYSASPPGGMGRIGGVTDA